MSMAGRVVVSRPLLASLGAEYGDALLIPCESGAELCCAWPSPSPPLSHSPSQAQLGLRVRRTVESVRRLEGSLSPPPLARALWLEVSPHISASSQDLRGHTKLLHRRIMIALSGRLVCGGGSLQMGGVTSGDACTVLVARIAPAELAAARVVPSTILHISVSSPSSKQSKAPAATFSNRVSTSLQPPPSTPQDLSTTAQIPSSDSHAPPRSRGPSATRHSPITTPQGTSTIPKIPSTIPQIPPMTPQIPPATPQTAPSKLPVSPPVFSGQLRAYQAVSRLLSAATTHAHQLHHARIRPPSGLLLYGPPGTGKTHVVRAAAEAHGLPLVVLQAGTSSVELGIQMRDAFNTAEARPLLHVSYFSTLYGKLL